MTPHHNQIHYIHFDTIDSTSLWVKANAATLDPNRITCVTALEQTAGRGRWNRKWVSPRGQNIYATLFFTLPLNCPFLSNLSQLLSLSCCTVLQHKGFSPQIKWPNDLLLDGKKVAGILCEVVHLEDKLGIALGIGININMTDELLDTVDQPATSLAQLSGHSWTLEQILEPLVLQFLSDLNTLEKEGFAPFVPTYDALLAFKGKQITCHDGVQTVQGICRSIDTMGKLNLQMEDGHLRIISAGEITFQKKT